MRLCNGWVPGPPRTLSGAKARRGDALFVATFNQRRQQLWESKAARLESLADKAIDTIEDVMENGETDAVRLRAVLAVLKGQGLADAGRPERDTDPERIEADWPSERRITALLRSF
jgi:hypothetical protein